MYIHPQSTLQAASACLARAVCVVCVCVACSLGDLVTLAKQAKFFMKKPAAAKPLPATPSCGFTLAKRPSSISGAGEGVFIQVCRCQRRGQGAHRHNHQPSTLVTHAEDVMTRKTGESE